MQHSVAVRFVVSVMCVYVRSIRRLADCCPSDARLQLHEKTAEE